MKRNLDFEVDESLKVGMLLSLVGGMLDAHTFLFRKGVFANTQTGNIVFFAMALLDNNLEKICRCFFSILAFVLGVFLTEILKKLKFLNLKFSSIVLFFEMALLAFLSIFPKNYCDNFVIIIVSFVCSLQTSSFRSLKGSLYSTTMCTGNLRSAVFNLFLLITKKEVKYGLVCVRYFIILASFFFGILAGRFLTESFNQFSLLFCSALLFIAFIFSFFEFKPK